MDPEPWCRVKPGGGRWWQDKCSGVLVHDFVVVGAGSAGCVLANRLSEDPASQVLLIEAGPEDSAQEMRVPALAATLWQGQFVWDNITVPQDNADERQVPWPSGRALGGSSSINGMIYIRGNRADDDAWRDTYGCASWGYADLLPTRSPSPRRWGRTGWSSIRRNGRCRWSSCPRRCAAALRS
ncbi:GMC family oxidoreductase N-terminal domain-containing protein [Lentzea nigeriaca]|uniref:GMC family oxidoreductase N-terminal domain-containing protein n=1 Tax=Lentzea nigeriaca TaxID=1128665 RepID=UPI00195A2F62|nr:GMC family oxidoreductase N-terminal domain-containing protein [Lentzea nigeriaca]MBM7860994.1 choline dehydrogenase-like flavoprotein [Lentzea nigeriaca]